MDDGLWSTSAVALRGLLAGRELSAVEVCEAHLDRVEAVNPELNAIVELNAEAAIEECTALDRLTPDRQGPLHGLPIAVKDLHDARGLLTTRGSLAWQDHRADRDDPWLAQLRAAGAIVLGKSNTPELGTKPVTVNRVYGATRNPWSLSHGTGGSSGGAGAAVSAGMVPLAQGSDAGGSCRQPASCCSVVGIKTSRGRVSLEDAVPGFGLLLESIGPFARSVEDAALFLDALAAPATPGAGTFLEAARREPGPLRLAAAQGIRGPGAELSPEVERVFAGSLERFSEAGHEIVEVDPGLHELHEPWLQFVLTSMGALAAELSPGELELIEPGNRRMMSRGGEIRAVEYTRALARADAVSSRLLAALEPFDALLTPTLTLPPFPLERLTPESGEDEIWRAFFSWAEFLHAFNVTGQPAISVPAGFTDDGLPVGLQIVGPPDGEAAILSLAAAFERAAMPDGPARPPLGS